MTLEKKPWNCPSYTTGVASKTFTEKDLQKGTISHSRDKASLLQESELLGYCYSTWVIVPSLPIPIPAFFCFFYYSGTSGLPRSTLFLCQWLCCRFCADPYPPVVHVLRKTTTHAAGTRLFHELCLSVLCSLGLLENLADVSVSPCCFSFCSLFLFPLCGFLALGVLNWSTALVPLFLLCVPRHFLRFFFVLICGGEVQSLGEVGGLAPLRF